jgi:uncharacterized protein (TIGR03435 family)
MIETHMRFVLAAAFIMAGSSWVVAQDQPAPTADFGPVPAFEVATIKPNSSPNGGPSGLSHGRFTATDVSIRGLLRFEGFDVPDARIVGGPKWMGAARFDIEATMSPDNATRFDSLSPTQKREMKEAMVQRLLAERFQFKSHWEQREMPVYALVVAKGGLKLQPAADLTHGSHWSLEAGKLQCQNVTLSQLADLFTQGASNELGRVVVDRTGVSGAYDLNVTWTTDNGASESTASGGASLFTAIQEQAGLKLESAKAPVKVLVVDQLEMPSGN